MSLLDGLPRSADAITLLVGARRESVSRCIRILRDAGAIDTSYGISAISFETLKTFSG
ncbi:MAG: helix-turn-helix domain-containing protein [bacterium]|nr:helix-turn-helix domain-containing protein [bacterium]